MLSSDLMRRINQIELRTKRLVQTLFAGGYESAYKGRGMAFSTVRPYIPGDDVRFIDWKVTARCGEPFVKQFVEERELTLMLVIDGSRSMFFGTQNKEKREFAAELAAALALAANHNNDRAGVIIFTDKVEHYVPPQKGRKHVLRIIRDILTYGDESNGQTANNISTGTDMSKALATINEALLPNSIVFILSDFLMPPATYERHLLIAGQKFDTSVVVFEDPLEQEMPSVGMMALQDAETGTIEWVDTNNQAWQQNRRENYRRLLIERENILTRARVGRVDIPPDRDYVRALSEFFQRKAL